MSFFSLLRVLLQIALVFFSFALFGLSCAGLATDRLKGDPATAVVALAGGATVGVVPGVMVLAWAKPEKPVATAWFEMSFFSVLFMVFTAGLATFTSETTRLRQNCASPPPADLRPFSFDLTCSLATSILVVGWLATGFLTLILIITTLFVLRRWWLRDPEVSKMPVVVLWAEGWWRPWRHAGIV
ncbi:hypothetical protein JCM6882_006726 [Rhodosporidiobolus microsporus]